MVRNNHELEAIFNVKLNGLADVEKYAREILAKGAQNVIISMAGDGALLVTPEAAYFAKPIKGKVKKPVGAGDSMVAGFTGEFVKPGDPIEALKWGRMWNIYSFQMIWRQLNLLKKHIIK